MIFNLSGGGGSGATLTVYAPAGVTVNLANSDESKTYTRIAGDDGTAVFKGLDTGWWMVEISDGVNNPASKPVNITADYTLTIAFFAATINVTYPPGSTCTATYGTTTLTAQDTSGSWECVVPNAGKWTVTSTSTDGKDRAEATVNITDDGQSETVTLLYALPYFYKDGDATVELLFNTTKYTNSGGYITITPSTSNPNIREPEAYFVIPDIEKYGAISCVLQYAYYTPIVYIRKISTGENVAQASPTSSGDTVSIDLSGLGLSGNDYYFVLYTKAEWHMTNGSTGDGYWEDVYAKTNHIWGDAK